MARKLSDQQVAEIHALKHLPQRDIARRLKLSLGAVNGALKAKLPSARTARVPHVPCAPTEPAPPDDVDDDVVVRLSRAIKSLERASALAEKSGDPARIVSAQRATTQALALAARLAPAPVARPEDNPDYKTLSQTAQERMAALISGVLTETGGRGGGENQSTDSPAKRMARDLLNQLYLAQEKKNDTP
jgi:hypothetical protein